MPSSKRTSLGDEFWWPQCLQETFWPVVRRRKAYQGDYLFDLDSEDDSDECTGCKYADLLESGEFFDAVAGVVDDLFTPDKPEPLTLFYARNTTNKHAMEADGAWGFYYEDPVKGDVFVPFGMKEGAEYGLKRHAEGSRNWYIWPLSEAEITEAPSE